jgi:hypothetical protein
MNEAKMSQTWTEQQEKYISFVARGKKTLSGEDRTDEEFAKAIGVDRKTLWRWRKLPGFAAAVFDEVLQENLHYLPNLMKSQLAGGIKKGKGGETPAATLILRQYELLKSDKIDHTTNGKDMPTPILGGPRE